MTTAADDYLGRQISKLLDAMRAAGIDEVSIKIKDVDTDTIKAIADEDT